MFATEQCLLVLTHHPAVWHQAAQFLDQSAKLLTEKGVRNVISIRFSVPDRFQVFETNVPLATLSSIERFCEDFQNNFLKIKFSHLVGTTTKQHWARGLTPSFYFTNSMRFEQLRHRAMPLRDIFACDHENSSLSRMVAWFVT